MSDGREPSQRACISRGPPPVSRGRPATTTGSRPTSAGRTGCSVSPSTSTSRRSPGNELRWWVVRREIGLAAGDAAGDAITDLYAAIYEVPRERVAEAGRLRGVAAEVRDRGANDDPDGPTGPGTAYWPEVARLLRDSYRSLQAALDED